MKIGSQPDKITITFCIMEAPGAAQEPEGELATAALDNLVDALAAQPDALAAQPDAAATRARMQVAALIDAPDAAPQALRAALAPLIRALPSATLLSLALPSDEERAAALTRRMDGGDLPVQGQYLRALQPRRERSEAAEGDESRKRPAEVEKVRGLRYTRRHRERRVPIIDARVSVCMRAAQAKPPSKRQRVVERERRRKERMAMGHRLCFTVSTGRECPHGDRFVCCWWALAGLAPQRRRLTTASALAQVQVLARHCGLLEPEACGHRRALSDLRRHRFVCLHRSCAFQAYGEAPTLVH